MHNLHRLLIASMLFGFTGSHLTAQTIPLASILSQNLPLVETPWSANCLDPNEFVTIWQRKGESVVRQFFLDGVPKGEAISFVDINSAGSDLWKLTGLPSGSNDAPYIVMQYSNNSYRLIEAHDGKSLVVRDGVNISNKFVTSEIKACPPGSPVYARYRTEESTRPTIIARRSDEGVTKNLRQDSTSIFTDPKTGLSINFGTAAGNNGACFAHLQTIGTRDPKKLQENYIEKFDKLQKNWVGAQVRMTQKLAAATSRNTITPPEALKRGLITQSQSEWAVGYMVFMNGLQKSSISDIALSYMSSCSKAGLIKF